METLYERKTEKRPAVAAAARKVQFVMVSSKYCNLRCSYCYEFPDLADRKSMSPAQLEHLYRSIADHYYRGDRPVALEFVWHGGEPLLLSPDFYWRTFDLQTRIFEDPKITVTNSVQTNLTVLNDRLIKLLQQGFDAVGVSIDLFSGLRVNSAGRDLQLTVLKNMDRLQEIGVPFSCLTVLSRRNRPHLNKIFQFFADAGITLRIEPVHRGADETQNDANLLSEDEVLQAYIELFEMWLESSAPFLIDPICTYIDRIISALSGKRSPCYNKSAWEYIYIVNTDGNLYSNSDIFDESLSHGNLFVESMHTMVGGSRHRRVIEAAESRMRAGCTDCRHHGRACSGYPMAEESTNRRDPKPVGAGSACTRERGILNYIEKRLLELGVVGSNGKLDTSSRYYPRLASLARVH